MPAPLASLWSPSNRSLKRALVPLKSPSNMLLIPRGQPASLSLSLSLLETISVPPPALLRTAALRTTPLSGSSPGQGSLVSPPPRPDPTPDLAPFPSTSPGLGLLPRSPLKYTRYTVCSPASRALSPHFPHWLFSSSGHTQCPCPGDPPHRGPGPARARQSLLPLRLAPGARGAQGWGAGCSLRVSQLSRPPGSPGHGWGGWAGVGHRQVPFPCA